MWRGSGAGAGGGRVKAEVSCTPRSVGVRRCSENAWAINRPLDLCGIQQREGALNADRNCCTLSACTLLILFIRKQAPQHLKSIVNYLSHKYKYSCSLQKRWTKHYNLLYSPNYFSSFCFANVERITWSVWARLLAATKCLVTQVVHLNLSGFTHIVSPLRHGVELNAASVVPDLIMSNDHMQHWEMKCSASCSFLKKKKIIASRGLGYFVFILPWATEKLEFLNIFFWGGVMWMQDKQIWFYKNYKRSVP